MFSSDPASLGEVVNLVGHSSTLFPSFPSLESSHMPAYNFQQLACAQVVPDTVSCKYQNVAVTYFVTCIVRILGGIA